MDAWMESTECPHRRERCRIASQAAPTTSLTTNVVGPFVPSWGFFFFSCGSSMCFFSLAFFWGGVFHDVGARKIISPSIPLHLHLSFQLILSIS